MTAAWRWMLGLEPADWSEGGRWSLQWAAAPGGDRALLWLALGVAFLVGLTWWQKREARRLGWAPRWTLWGLRAAAAAVVAVMLLEPVVVLSKTEYEPSRLLVLRDVSPSMGLIDAWRDGGRAAAVARAVGLPDAAAVRGATRGELAERALGGERVGGLAERLALGGERVVVDLPFAESIVEAARDGGESERPGVGTGIGAALREAVGRYRGVPVAGVLIVSDGQSNAGPSVEQAARFAAEAGVPVAALAVGTEEGPRNAEVVGVQVDPVVFERDTVSVAVVVRSRGMDGEAAAVTLERSRGGGPWETVGREPLQLGEAGATREVGFTFTEETPGDVRLRATLTVDGAAASGTGGTSGGGGGAEQDADDNAALAEVRVIRRQLRVLLIAGSTFPEVQFLRNTLLRDKTVDLSTWLMTADAEYQHPGDTPIRRLPQTTEGLNEYDALVLYDPDPDGFPPGFGELMQQFVGQAGGGLVYVAGEQHTRSSFDRQGDPLLDWLGLLPVVREAGLFRTAQQLTWSARDAWRLLITPEGRADPIFSFDPDPEKNRRVLDVLPGMYWHFPVTRPRPAATVLARHGDPRMVNDYGPEVLMATQLVGPGRSLFIAFDSTYRWRYLGEGYFDGFWGRVIDRAGRAKRLGGVYPFRLRTDRATYRPGSRVTVTARFIDPATLDPGLTVMQAEATRGDDEPIAFTLTRQPDDSFEGSFDAAKTGDHLVGVWPGEPTEAGAGVRPATLRVEVAQADAEFDHPGLDRAALQTIAGATGGRVVDLERVDEVPGAFTLGHVARTLEDRQAVWDAPVLWMLLMGLLIAEWVLRKRWRLV